MCFHYVDIKCFHYVVTLLIVPNFESWPGAGSGLDLADTFFLHFILPSLLFERRGRRTCDFYLLLLFFFFSSSSSNFIFFPPPRKNPQAGFGLCLCGGGGACNARCDRLYVTG